MCGSRCNVRKRVLQVSHVRCPTWMRGTCSAKELPPSCLIRSGLSVQYCSTGSCMYASSPVSPPRSCIQAAGFPNKIFENPGTSSQVPPLGPRARRMKPHSLVGQRRSVWVLRAGATWSAGTERKVHCYLHRCKSTPARSRSMPCARQCAPDPAAARGSPARPACSLSAAHLLH